MAVPSWVSRVHADEGAVSRNEEHVRRQCQVPGSRWGPSQNRAPEGVESRVEGRGSRVEGR
eukprot:3531676-Rhodomonas_salina.1